MDQAAVMSPRVGTSMPCSVTNSGSTGSSAPKPSRMMSSATRIGSRGPSGPASVGWRSSGSRAGSAGHSARGSAWSRRRSYPRQRAGAVRYRRVADGVACGGRSRVDCPLPTRFDGPIVHTFPHYARSARSTRATPASDRAVGPKERPADPSRARGCSPGLMECHPPQRARGAPSWRPGWWTSARDLRRRRMADMASREGRSTRSRRRAHASVAGVFAGSACAASVRGSARAPSPRPLRSRVTAKVASSSTAPSIKALVEAL